MAASPIILPGLPHKIPLDENQQDCVDKIREVLKEAEAGNVLTVGIVVCMRNGFATTIAGTDAGSLNLGCDALKQRILERVIDDTTGKPVRRS